MTLILGIETSCDETAAAVVEDGQRIFSNVVASQIDIHRRYGGVFPEVASRQHILSITPIIKEAMEEARVSWDDLEAVAVTYGPGLAGSLLVGVNAAKGIALGCGLPLLGINHIEAHIYANWLTPPLPGGGGGGEPPAGGKEGWAFFVFPVLCLVVSGGHTELILMSGHGRYQRLGSTLDDAAGEAFDKVGRLLELGYPGGPAIEQAAQFGDPAAFDLPRAWLGDSHDFSFSGLKTAVLRMVKAYKKRPLPVVDLAASFQAAVVDVLVEKTKRAAEEYRVEQILLSGGVAANKLLRQEMAQRSDLPVLYPPISLCTDNAAMVAGAAYFRYQAGYRSGWDLDVIPNLKLVGHETRAAGEEVVSRSTDGA
ncbi:MAG: tRNA (adenosine(37)-N6)-threonylcarbamoyltransferase complex transferase subunit TsaD [Chloroflexi bacterium]|nr:tRNA (adenosine(37)-N6)-threonylcarbamoyltransferase complex transferase subunit TsaD [Chloroflexota bacterium]